MLKGTLSKETLVGPGSVHSRLQYNMLTFLFVNLVGFGCKLGFILYLGMVSTDPSCTQIRQIFLLFFLALRWGANPFAVTETHLTV